MVSLLDRQDDLEKARLESLLARMFIVVEY
jgi:hypothetical protein